MSETPKTDALRALMAEIYEPDNAALDHMLEKYAELERETTRPEALRIPDGWKLVPIFMTNEMVQAFFYSDIFQGGKTNSAVRACWAETVGAAPGLPGLKDTIDKYCELSRAARGSAKTTMHNEPQNAAPQMPGSCASTGAEARVQSPMTIGEPLSQKTPTATSADAASATSPLAQRQEKP